MNHFSDRTGPLLPTPEHFNYITSHPILHPAYGLFTALICLLE